MIFKSIWKKGMWLLVRLDFFFFSFFLFQMKSKSLAFTSGWLSISMAIFVFSVSFHPSCCQNKTAKTLPQGITGDNPRQTLKTLVFWGCLQVSKKFCLRRLIELINVLIPMKDLYKWYKEKAFAVSACSILKVKCCNLIKLALKSDKSSTF